MSALPGMVLVISALSADLAPEQPPARDPQRRVAQKGGAPGRSDRARAGRITAATAPIGTWIGQDGHDLVGQSPAQAGNGVQDIHIALGGLPRQTIAGAVVKGLGGDEWQFHGPPGAWLALIVRKGDSPTADLYVDPAREENGRSFNIQIRFDDGQTTDFWVKGGKATPNLRTQAAAMKARWLGQDGQDWTGPGPAVGPDGLQDTHVALANLAGNLPISAVRLEAPGGLSWNYGVNPKGEPSAELVRPTEKPAQADLYFTPRSDLKGKPLTVTVTYGNATKDTARLSAGRTDPRLRMPARSLPRLSSLSITTRWLAQDPTGHVGAGDAHVALDGLPAGSAIAAAALSDSARGCWVFRAREDVPFETDPYPTPMALLRSPGSTHADLYFPPLRDESGGTMTLRVRFDDGHEALARFPGGPCDPGMRSPPRAPGSNAAKPGDDLHALVRAGGTLRLAKGTYRLDRPLILENPIQIVAEPGTTLRFSQRPTDPPWSAAIKIHCGQTALEGFAVRFDGEIRWADVSYGPAVIGTTDNLDHGYLDPKGSVALVGLDLDVPGSARPGTWTEALHLARLVTANSGRIVKNRLRGGAVEFAQGPWQVLDNEHRGVPEWTHTPVVFAGHNTHDLVLKGNRAHAVGPSGKTWRFLVLTQSGSNDLVSDNTVEDVGPRDGDRIPNMNAPEIMLTEAYRLHFEGKPSSLSADGRLLQIPPPQGERAQTGDAVAILSSPEAGQWRRIAQAIGATTYLVDPPLPQGDYAIAVATGFVNERFEGNTVDARGGSVAVNLVLAGNHYGTRVQANHFLGGGEAVRIMAAASEQPMHWGWSHAPFLGGVIEQNTVEDSPRGGTICVEHTKAVKSTRGRVYMSLAFQHNTVGWSRAFLASHHSPAREQTLVGWTLGDPGSLDPQELRIEATDNRARMAAGHRARTVLQVRAAAVNGKEIRDRMLDLPAARAPQSTEAGPHTGPAAARSHR